MGMKRRSRDAFWRCETYDRIEIDLLVRTKQQWKHVKDRQTRHQWTYVKDELRQQTDKQINERWDSEFFDFQIPRKFVFNVIKQSESVREIQSWNSMFSTKIL
jgi:hypothetical protein